MTAYRSEQVINDMPVPSHGLGDAVHCQRFKVSLTAAVTTADTIQFGNLPAYARVVDMTLKSTDIDTNGTPTVTINVGDAGDPDRYFAAATVGQTGAVARMSVATGFSYLYGSSNANMITGAIAANAATGVAGTLELLVFYTIEDTGVGYPS